MDPHNAKAYFNKGMTLAALKRYDEAIQEFNEALAIDPDFTLAKV
jgi:tetratricopeptide (TPR) repeat protein